MRVSKTQIVQGITDYIKNDILPKMENDRAVQIILAIAVNAAAANSSMIESIFDNEIILKMLDDNGSGTYDVGSLADAMKSAINQYGSFPVNIPSIPLVSPREITLNLNAEDVDAIRRRIEVAM